MTDYDKPCKKCGEKFTPYRTFDKFCYVCKKTEEALKNLEKIKKEKKKKQKEDLLTLQDYLKLAQQVFNKYINARDRGKNCISCFKPIKGRVNASHYYNANNHYSLRFDEDNVHSSCITCNQFLSGNLIQYRKGLLERIGEAKISRLDELSNVTRKFTKEELKELIIEYKERIKDFSQNV
jgi:hypothetical protein